MEKKHTHTQRLIGENNIITSYNHELTLFPANKRGSSIIEFLLISEVAQRERERNGLGSFSRPFYPD